ncbi:hypothetical protein ACFFWD_34840, partial [Bradyrhizobium erythrophlei]|uniref:hypothetical protein n=1 Tax=Bradyrhizobium erythrophlei TaxID=1437360 RepID=UPI0035EFAA6C
TCPNTQQCFNFWVFQQTARPIGIVVCHHVVMPAIEVWVAGEFQHHQLGSDAAPAKIVRQRDIAFQSLVPGNRAMWYALLGLGVGLCAVIVATLLSPVWLGALVTDDVPDLLGSDRNSEPTDTGSRTQESAIDSDAQQDLALPG